MVLKMAWHYQSPSSHHQPSILNHAGSKQLRSVTRQNRISYHTRLANIPFLCAVNTMLVLSSLVHGKPTHPMVSSRMPCTPLRVCAPSPASQSGLAPSSMLSATVLVHRKPTRTHTPCGQLKDAVHSPTSVRTIPRFPIRASIIDVVQLYWFTANQLAHTHTLWSAQGCRALPYECAHHLPLPNPG